MHKTEPPLLSVNPHEDQRCALSRQVLRDQLHNSLIVCHVFTVRVYGFPKFNNNESLVTAKFAVCVLFPFHRNVYWLL